MDDLISRQAAINKFKSIITDKEHTSITDEAKEKIARKFFSDIPSSTQRWIPCSEDLPKRKDGRVLITLEDEVTTAIYSEFSKTWYIGDMCGVGNKVPIAWMSLPKPYKREEDNDYERAVE